MQEASTSAGMVSTSVAQNISITEAEELIVCDTTATLRI